MPQTLAGSSAREKKCSCETHASDDDNCPRWFDAKRKGNAKSNTFSRSSMRVIVLHAYKIPRLRLSWKNGFLILRAWEVDFWNTQFKREIGGAEIIKNLLLWRVRCEGGIFISVCCPAGHTLMFRILSWYRRIWHMIGVGGSSWKLSWTP